MTGILDKSGLGEPIPPGEPKSTEFLRSFCRKSNRQLVHQLQEATEGAELLRIARKDAMKGRMTEPKPIEVPPLYPSFSLFCSLCVPSASQECDRDAILLHPRFAVVTERPDGSKKACLLLRICAMSCPSFLTR